LQLKLKNAFSDQELIGVCIRAINAAAAKQSAAKQDESRTVFLHSREEFAIVCKFLLISPQAFRKTTAYYIRKAEITFFRLAWITI